MIETVVDLITLNLTIALSVPNVPLTISVMWTSEYDLIIENIALSFDDRKLLFSTLITVILYIIILISKVIHLALVL